MTGRFFLRIFLLIALAAHQGSADSWLPSILGRSLQSPLAISLRLLASPFFPPLTGPVILIGQPLGPLASILAALWTTIACHRMCRPERLLAVLQQTASSAGRGMSSAGRGMSSAGRGILNLTATRISWKRAHGRCCSHWSSLEAKFQLRFEATLHTQFFHGNSVKSAKPERQNRDPRFAVLADHHR